MFGRVQDFNRGLPIPSLKERHVWCKKAGVKMKISVSYEGVSVREVPYRYFAEFEPTHLIGRARVYPWIHLVEPEDHVVELPVDLFESVFQHLQVIQTLPELSFTYHPDTGEVTPI